jgi:hypothetical protein
MAEFRGHRSHEGGYGRNGSTVVEVVTEIRRNKFSFSAQEVSVPG